MFELEMILIAFVILLALSLYTIGKYTRGWNLTNYLKTKALKAMNLYDTPVGSFTNHVMRKAKDWENTKFYFIIGPVMAGYAVFFIFFFLPAWLPILIVGAAFFVVVIVLLSTFIYIKYYAHYTKYEAREVDVQESPVTRFRDHWPIAASVELDPDDPRIDRAHALVKTIMERRKREQEAADNANNNRNPSNPSTAAVAVGPSEPEATEAEPAPAAELLPCRVCGATPDKTTGVYCQFCGAKFFPDEYYTLETRGFCPEDDPWYQYLIISDCVMDRHRLPITQEFYAGKIPVTKPVNKMAYAQVGQILNTTTDEDTDDRMIPVVMITNSIEYARRITRQQRAHPFSEEGFATAGHTYDGYTALKATELLAIAHQQLQTVKDTKRHGDDESKAIAMEIVGTYLESKKPPKPEQTRFEKVWQVGKWVLLAAVILIGVALFIFFGLPLLQGIASQPPPTNSTLPELLKVMR